MTDQSPEIEDTEGHSRRLATEEPQSPDVHDDTEGHQFKFGATDAPPSPDSDDDTEGQSWKF